MEKRKLDGEVSGLRQEKMQLSNQVKDLKKEYNITENMFAELEQNGCTREIISRIHGMEKRHGKDLLNQVETAEVYNKLVDKSTLMKKLNKDLKMEGEIEKKRVRRLKDDVRELEIVYDEIRMRALTYSHYVDLTEDIIKEGYTVDDLKSLFSGLRLVQVKGAPKKSIKSLVDRLLRIRRLYELETEIKKCDVRLSEIKDEINLLTEKRDAMLEGITKTIEKLVNLEIKKIKEFFVQIETTLETEGRQSEDFFKSQEEKLAHVLGTLKLDIQIFGELNQEIARLGEDVNYGRAFWAFDNSDEYLLGLDPEFLARVLDRVAYWASAKLNTKITIPPEMAYKTGLNMYIPFNLSALLNLLADIIRKKKKE